MRHHINVLYGAVILLLILQLILFITISSQSAKLIAQQEKFENSIESTLGKSRQENQYRIGEIVRTISQQRRDFEEQIELLKTTQNDFSLVIEDAVKKVVTVATDISAGTGFIVGNEGYILTNQHVVADSAIIQVQTYDGEVYEAELIGVDATVDIAVLKISEQIEGFELADSDDVAVGQKIIAIGNPLGLDFTVTEGIVSALDRDGPSVEAAYVQTDVTLNPGNSGGPLVDSSGKVIGMANFKVGGAEALGFALESDMVRETANNIAGAIIVT
ncbi:MAG: trypsin-like peptidase domain-containing protein [Nanoarchaeota archaeon]